jgi:hypothetical protein
MPVAAGISAATTVMAAGEVTAHVTATTHTSATHVTATMTAAVTAAASISDGRYQRQRQHRRPRKKDISYRLFQVDFLVNIIIYRVRMVETPVRS